MPIFWQCDRCTECCRWPGQVRVTDAESARIADHLGLAVPDFIREFTRLTWQRDGLALTDQADGSCVFLDGNDCRIQPVKPQQCRDFPNLWNFPDFEKVCHAKPVNVSADEWRRRITASTGRDAQPPEDFPGSADPAIPTP